MTGAVDHPSLSPDTPLPSQNDMLTAAGADALDGSTPPAAGAPGVADMEEAESFPPRADGRPRTQIVVRPRPDLLADQPDEVAPNGVGPAEHTQLRAQGIEDRGTKSAGASVPEDVDPVDQLVEFVFPTRSFTDWLIADPLNRWGLFKEAIAKDSAGVDAAFDRARAVGYRAGRFTESLKTLVASLKPPASEERPIAGAFEQKSEQATRQRGGQIALPDNWQTQEDVNRNETLRMVERGFNRRVAAWAELGRLPGSSEQTGLVLNDATPGPNFVAGRRYAQLANSPNRAVTGDKRIDETTARLLVALEETFKELGPGWGARFGTRAHYAFAEKVKSLRLKGVGEKDVEASFSFGQLISYGLKNSIRVDIVLRDRFGTPIAVYDLKTGGAKLKPARVQELADAAGVPIDRVIELRYVELSAEQRW